jgi:hypothetical protein
MYPAAAAFGVGLGKVAGAVAGTKVGGAAISGVIDAGLSYRESRNLGQAALAGLMAAGIDLATAPLVSKMWAAVPLGAMLGIFSRRADDLPVGPAVSDASTNENSPRTY